MKSIRLFVTTLALMLCVTTLAFASSANQFGIEVVPQTAILINDEGQEVGTAKYWNTRDNFIVELQVEDGWLIKDAQIYAGEDPPTLDKKDKPVKEEFPCHRDFAEYLSVTMAECSLLEHELALETVDQ